MTLPDRNSSKTVSERHPKVVADVHDDVKHIPMSPSMPPTSSPAVLVASATPKSRPQIVTDAYPLKPSLRRASDMTAASNEKHWSPCPNDSGNCEAYRSEQVCKRIRPARQRRRRSPARCEARTAIAATTLLQPHRRRRQAGSKVQTMQGQRSVPTVRHVQLHV